MILCVILLWPSKIKCSLILIQNMFNVWALRTNWLKNLFFERFGLNPFVFEKLLISYTCNSFMKHCALRSFCIKILFFFFFNSRFSIDQIYLPTDRKFDKNLGLNLHGSIDARLMLDRSNMFFDRSNLIFNWSKFESWVL